MEEPCCRGAVHAGRGDRCCGSANGARRFAGINVVVMPMPDAVPAHRPSAAQRSQGAVRAVPGSLRCAPSCSESEPPVGPWSCLGSPSCARPLSSADRRAALGCCPLRIAELRSAASCSDHCAEPARTVQDDPAERNPAVEEAVSAASCWLRCAVAVRAYAARPVRSSCACCCRPCLGPPSCARLLPLPHHRIATDRGPLRIVELRSAARCIGATIIATDQPGRFATFRPSAARRSGEANLRFVRARPQGPRRLSHPPPAPPGWRRPPSAGPR